MFNKLRSFLTKKQNEQPEEESDEEVTQNVDEEEQKKPATKEEESLKSMFIVDFVTELIDGLLDHND